MVTGIVTGTGKYRTRSGENVEVLKIKDNFAIGYWGKDNPAKWCTWNGSFVEGVMGFFESHELSLVEQKKLKLFSEQEICDSSDQLYLYLRRIDKDTIRLSFVDKNGDFVGGGYILTITSEGLIRHPSMSREVENYIKMDEKNRIKLIDWTYLC